MNNNITFTSINWLSVIAAIAVVSYGFISPVSIIQALVYNPIVLTILLVSIAYTTKKPQKIKSDSEYDSIPHSSLHCGRCL